MGRSSGRKNIPREPVPGSPEGDDIGLSARQDPAGSPIPGLTGNIVNYETVRQVPEKEQESFDEYRGMMAHGVPNASEVTEERALMVRDGTIAQHRPPGPPKHHVPDTVPSPVPVFIVEAAGGTRPLCTLAGQKITIPATGTTPARVTARDETRTDLWLRIENTAGSGLGAAVTAPAVPATTVPAQNTSPFPVQVVIAANGATITAVTVNGVTVGVAAGTYVVPAFGSIAISYTVATPTWAWTGYSGPTGIRISHEVGDLDVGGGALVKPGDNWVRFDGFQDELFAVSNDSTAVVISLVLLFEIPAGG
jgi:hypothetical protein